MWIDPNSSWSTEIGAQSLHFGEGSLSKLGEVCAALGGRRVLVVTDPGIRAAGHVGRAVRSLEEAGCQAAVFDQVEENPTTVCVEGAAAAARDHQADLLVGLGGGSAMDSAKGANFLVTNGGRMEDYWGFGKARQPLLPSVGVPTTAGTGSEAQSYALITQKATHRKMACGDPGARFRTVVLDPELLRTAPREVTAVSGYDAISHAVESFVCRRRNPISVLFAGEAWRRLQGSYEALLADAENAWARAEMLFGAYLAGAAIELSMLGAAHSCANPLTARFGVVHGNAVGLMLPAVVRFNGEVVDELYGQLLAAADPASHGNGHGHAGELSRRLEFLRQVGSGPQTLREVGIGSADLDALALEAAEQWTAQFNPRPVSPAELRALYEEVL